MGENPHTSLMSLPTPPIKNQSTSRVIITSAIKSISAEDTPGIDIVPPPIPENALLVMIRNPTIIASGIKIFHHFLDPEICSHQGATIRPTTRNNTIIETKVTPSAAKICANQIPILPETGENATMYRDIINASRALIL